MMSGMKTLRFRLPLIVLLAWTIFVPLTTLAQQEEAPAGPEPSAPTLEIPQEDSSQAVAESNPVAGVSDQPRVADKEATLRVWNRFIIEIRAEVAGIDPAERVSQAVRRITSLPAEGLRKEVWTEPVEIRGIDFILIGVDANVLLALTQLDLDPTSDQTLEELAADAAARIQEVLRARADQRHWPTVLRGIGYSLAATLLFLVLMLVILRLRARLVRILTRALAKGSVQVSGFDLKPYLRNLVRGAVASLSWILIIPLGYLWLTFVLNRFPFTRPWGAGLRGFLVDLLSDLFVGALGAIPGLFTVFLIFLLTRFLTRIVGAFFLTVEKGALEVHWLQPDVARATRRVVIVIMWIFALTVAYPYIPGSGTAAFKGVSVFVGLMISLGATGMVNQVVSGMVIVYARAFSPGEFVRIGETEGFVEEIGVLSTKVATLRREHVTIPNAVLINTSVQNYSRNAADGGSVIATSVTIGYDVPWRQVHALLELAARRCSGLREGQEPRVLQKGLSDFYVEYTLLISIDNPAERYIVASELNGLIQDAFNEHGVQILSPHFLDKAEEPVVIPKDGWVKPPAGPSTE